MTPPTPTWEVRRFRDLQVLVSPSGEQLVVACDSVGGLGDKPADTIQADPRVVMHFAARVTVLEVVAVGAQPLLVVDTLGVERSPSGQRMIDELKELAAELGLDPDTAISGSTEDNVATRATGFGVTVIASVPKSGMRVGGTRNGDHVYCLGIPLSAPEHHLRRGDERMPTISEVRTLVESGLTHEVLPVGSRGVRAEALDLVAGAGLELQFFDTAVDLDVTAGPSSCVLVALAPATSHILTSLRPTLPIGLIGVARTAPQKRT